ncbi:MAG: hypothetical protein HZA15_15400 [Nitrospirae bacterium]|nr:hypothetical protein [Nitrospirota bacterium]
MAAIETIRPTDANGYSLGWSNRAYAYDGLLYSYANKNNLPTGNPVISLGAVNADETTNAWQAKAQTWISATAYIKMYAFTIDDLISVTITDKNGNLKHTVRAAAIWSAGEQTLSVALNSADWGGAGFPNIANLRIRVNYTRTGGGDGTQTYIYEGWIEGRYNTTENLQLSLSSAGAINIQPGKISNMSLSFGAVASYSSVAKTLADLGRIVLQSISADIYSVRSMLNMSLSEAAEAAIEWIIRQVQEFSISIGTAAGVAVSIAKHSPIPIEQARDNPRFEQVFLAIITLKNGGPTLYHSTRNLSVFGYIYEDYLVSVSGLSSDVRRADLTSLNSDLTLIFKNDRILTYDYLSDLDTAYPFMGASLLLQEVYISAEGDLSEIETVFSGVLDQPTDIGLKEFTCQASTLLHDADRRWKQRTVNLTDFPYAHEDIGKVIPIVYGSNIRIPALRTNWGARTTLKAGISASPSSIELSDASRFPSSGDAYIDSEVIHYTGKAGNTLTGVTRAQAGTTAVDHSAGASVWQKQALYESVAAAHNLASRGDIFAEINGELLRVTSGISSRYDSTGYILTASDQIKVETSALRVSESSGATSFNHTVKSDDMPSQLLYTGLSTGASLPLHFPAAPSGTLSAISVRCTLLITVLGNPASTVTIYAGPDKVNYPKVADIQTDGTIVWYLPQTFDMARSGWSTTQNLFVFGGNYGSTNIIITAYDADQSAVSTVEDAVTTGGELQRAATTCPVAEQITYAAYKTIFIPFPAAPGAAEALKNIIDTYSLGIVVTTPRSVDTIIYAGPDNTYPKVATVKATSGDVVWHLPQTFSLTRDSWNTTEKFFIGGNSATGDITFTISAANRVCISTAIADGLTVSVTSTKDVERFHITASGPYSRPDQVIKDFLQTWLGIASNNIDTASFAAAGSWFATNNYAFGFALLDQIMPSDLLKKMAFECRSTLIDKQGVFYLDVIPDTAPAAVKTISQVDLAPIGAEITFSQPAVADIANDLEATYQSNYSALRNNSCKQGTVTASDAASIAKYGRYVASFSFDLIQSGTMAASVLANILLRRKLPYLTANMPLLWQHFDLRPGDTIDISYPIYDGKKFFIEKVKREGAKVTIEGVEWY